MIQKIVNHINWRKNQLIKPLRYKKLEKITVEPLNSTKRKKKIIVSVTSYKKRMKKLHICIKSIFLQSVQPDKIILYLHVNDKEYVTRELYGLEKSGLEIRFVDEDLKPHKKYYYAMREFPDDIIITVDDDAMYSSKLIENLLKTHYIYPKYIIAARGRMIDFDILSRKFKPYDEWNLNTRENIPSMKLLATGVGGVLYPPRVLDYSILLNKKEIKKYIETDDLWLKAVEIVSEVPTVLCSKKVDMNRIDIEEVQKDGLFNTNTGEFGTNDKNWKRLAKQFELVSLILNK